MLGLLITKSYFTAKKETSQYLKYNLISGLLSIIEYNLIARLK